MFGIHDLALFIASSLLLNLMPGPDSLLVMLRTAGQGWRAGVAATWGIGSGIMVHVLCAALGLSALLAASAQLFALVKLAGALYLVYLGLTLLRRHAAVRDSVPLPAMPLWAIYRQGMLTNVLNPKVALFFLAFMPQFIDPAGQQQGLAFILLGGIFNLGGMIWCHLLVLITATARHRLHLPARVKRALERLIGALFLAFGIRLAIG
ncbi:LysE family translocator [Aeromonas simiae]|uniref:LysE family translocator n=1 Tax=Aeromonas simiae TaxID=218936 RepID=UPI00266B9C35|nr:LysE family translocator [Aeromonas simiae]MDO2949338.1 LysE family translocator [Aeromonas simiae]MDO2952802.1 LysE family translocator [Aeromonas simiae]MDO2956539.1 LysE family translocator [Aeromonas simiae]